MVAAFESFSNVVARRGVRASRISVNIKLALTNRHMLGVHEVHDIAEFTIRLSFAFSFTLLRRRRIRLIRRRSVLTFAFGSKLRSVSKAPPSRVTTMRATFPLSFSGFSLKVVDLRCLIINCILLFRNQFGSARIDTIRKIARRTNLLSRPNAENGCTLVFSNALLVERFLLLYYLTSIRLIFGSLVTSTKFHLFIKFNKIVFRQNKTRRH